ncbi:LPS export ABC transporter periplasmic protein LptC [Roseateles violae]|uniref:LPS export ABC transporter periplasmic protein LptC n=1 Tax=Roseateles violae TaxID=3058042 RepID=A0ABT8DKZ3_9BURK|nr:LPS export ABC transporter periplasmic protein LptC [Pelomonas sp. PFR6]MDN3919085.1 LPS export ABC transporter periplasmic protein LptC [Pelomonas sp. PFR6]
MAASLAPPRAAATPRRPQPWIWRLQSLLTSYLPLLLMAFLATGTWWLVKNTPGQDEEREAAPARHEPDYRMRDFELRRIGADGRLRVRIEGAEMRHYPDTDTLEIDGVRLRAFAPDGSLTLATARRATSNADASDLQLLGDVRVTRHLLGPGGEPLAQPQLVVSGEFLQALVNEELLRSHLPAVLSYSGGEVHAQSFEYDHLHGKLRFAGHTTGRFEMPPARNSKGRGR